MYRSFSCSVRIFCWSSAHAHEAAVDSKQALAMLEKSAQPGTYSCDVGHVRLGLGRALQAQGKQKKLAPPWNWLNEHLKNACGPDHPDVQRAHQLLSDLR